MLHIVAAAATATTIPLATFDGAPSTTFKFVELNDPVMGGRSKSTFAVKDGVGVFDGTAAIVPSLKAPGFCNLETTDGLGVFTRGADMSPYSHLLLRVRSTTPAYPGFKVSLAANTVTWAREFARYGIRATAVAPGMIETPMTKGMHQKARDALVAAIPVGRIGEPEDIWQAVRFAVECEYFNGRCLDVDGGLVMT